MPDITQDDDAMRAMLQPGARIAMIGASADPSRDSHRVFGYLLDHGYTVVPVTPKPDLVHGVEPVATLEEAKDRLGGHIDIVDVFRAVQYTPDIARESVRLGASGFWLQFNTVHPDAVQIGVDGGMDVVVDRCIRIEHARLGL